MILSSTSPASSWPSLPAEIQLAITELLDVKALHSLSLVSRYNHTLCIPAIYSVRWPMSSPMSPIMLIGRVSSRSRYHPSAGFNTSYVTCPPPMRYTFAPSTSAPPPTRQTLPPSHRRRVPTPSVESFTSPPVSERSLSTFLPSYPH